MAGKSRSDETRDFLADRITPVNTGLVNAWVTTLNAGITVDDWKSYLNRGSDELATFVDSIGNTAGTQFYLVPRTNAPSTQPDLNYVFDLDEPISVDEWANVP